MTGEIYIESMAQISAQKPLSEEWMDAPIVYDPGCEGTIDPDFKEYLHGGEGRRMGKLLKRALVCAREAMEKAGIDMPDGIITATGLGCIENTERFLDPMVRLGEQLLNPTPFMQSTHNAIGSAIALSIKCHSYNTHYSHRWVSFECALQDAFMQLQNENAHIVLLNAHDENSPIFDSILKKIDCWNFANGGFKGEIAVSLVMTGEPTSRSLCCVKDMSIRYRPSYRELKTELETMLNRNRLTRDDLDAVFVGVNGNAANDAVYAAVGEELFDGLPMVRYKHLFGEHFTASGLGLYAAATCIGQGRIPAHMLPGESANIEQVKHVVLYNHSENREHSFVLLKGLC